MASTSTSDVPSIPVVFTTKTAYPLPSQKFMIPSTWRRYQLSQLINKALSLPRVIPFDFLIGGEVLKGSLEERAAGEEETLEIEYIESVMPPKRMANLPHEDWVSDISCQLPEHFLTSSYDGSIRVFSYAQSLLLTSPVHTAPITSISLIPSVSPSKTMRLVATASHDLTAQISEISLPLNQNDMDIAPSTKTLASLHLHTAPLSAIHSNSTGSRLLTSSWDGLIGLWDTTIPDSDEIPLTQIQAPGYGESGDRKKRRKVDKDTDGETPGKGAKGVRKAPSAVLKSHTARVSDVQFGRGNEGKAVSCGFDSTLREWDVENGVCTNTISASEKPFLALALPSPSTHPSAALAAATDRTVTLYDLRSSAATTSSTVSFSHASAPSCLTFSSQEGSQQFVSGAYDGVVRLWDLRSAGREMASFKVWDGAQKVLGVDWSGSVVGIAGEGGVEVWKVGQDTEK